MTKRIFRVCAPLIVLFPLLAACSTAASAQPAPPTPTPLPPALALEPPTYTVTRGTIERPLDINGRVAPVDLVHIAFRKTGRVATVNVKSGDQVAAGTVLAELEQADALDLLRRAQNGLVQAQRDLQLAQAQHTLAVRQAENNLAVAHEQAGDTTAQHDIEVQRAQNNLERARQDYAQAANQQSIQIQQAQNNLAQAQADYEQSATQQAILVQQAENNLAEAQRDAAAVQQQQAETIKQAERELQRAQEQLARLLPGGADDRVAEAQDALASAQQTADTSRTEASTAKTQAEDNLRRAANTVQEAQHTYSEAYWDYEWVKNNGTDPRQPTNSDPDTGATVPNELTDQQKANYKFAFEQAQNALADAEAGLQLAQRALDEARAAEVTTNQNADALVQEAQHNLDLVLDEQQGDSQIIAARQDVQDAQIARDAALRDSAASETTVHNAELAVEAARNSTGSEKTQVANAALAVNSARNSTTADQTGVANAALSVDSARHDTNAAQANLTNAELALEVARQETFNEQIATVENAQADLDTAQRAVDAGRVIAPRAGAVLSLAIAPGDSIEAFDPVVEVADLSTLEIAADLSNEQMLNLSLGQAATISLLAEPDVSLAATIRWLPSGVGIGASGGIAEEDQRTRFAITGGQQLTAGAVAKIHIVLERKDNVLWLPPEAIRDFEGRQFVEVREGTRTRRVPVRLGIETPTQVEIVDGLAAGDTVVGQ